MNNKKLKAVIAAITIFSCQALFAQGETLRVIESAVTHNLDPHSTSFSFDAQILDGLFEGLFSYDPRSSGAVAAIAKDYKISRDKKRWTFNLREDAAFSNNMPITASDVRNSWIQLLKNPDAPYASLLDIVVGAKEFRTGLGSEEEVGIYTTGPFTLMVKLTEPAPYLPNLLCHHTLAVVNQNPTVFSGAYVLDDYTQESIVLKKNPYYWDAEKVKIETLEFSKSLGSDENAFAFNSGSADWVSTGDFNSEKVINRDGIQLSSQFGTEFFFFRTKDMKPGHRESIWDNPEFRLALLEAMPWEILRENDYFPAKSLVPSMPDYPEVNGFSYSDLAQAKIMMADARKNAGIALDEMLELKMTLSIYALTDKQEKAVREVCKELGINPIITYQDFYTYMTLLPTSDSDIGVYSWIGDYADPLSFLDLFRGNSTLNASGWKNETFDNLLTQSSLCSTTAERYKLLAQAEQVLLDDGMILPICTPVSVSLINLDEIGGWANNVYNLHPLKYLYKKETSTTLPFVVMK